MERKLAAILAADVVGYTRLIGQNEVGTLRRLTQLLDDALQPLISEHRGRLFKLMGDGMLVEFASLTDAVRCAVAWHTVVAANEVDQIEDSRLCFRIGLNMGEVIVEGDDIYGEGVIVAARLESIAEPGGTFLSSDAYRQIRGKIETRFEDLGERDLKGVVEPVRVFRVAADQLPSVPAQPSTGPLPLPDKPSIAVLPFTNMSGNPEQDYFSDGITEDIITALSKISSLFIVARNSTFIYKGQAVDVRRVGREQGVQFVLEGSVRRAGDRLRITAQLIDAITGSHVWSERYDRTLEDIFALQDDITLEVTTAIQVELLDGEQARIKAAGTQKFEAWELAVKGRDLLLSSTREGTRKARVLLEQATQVDPDYAAAWCSLAWVHWNEARHGWSTSPGKSLAKSWKSAERANELAPDLAEPFALLANTALQQHDYTAAEKYADSAIKRAGSEAGVIAGGAMVLSHCGRPIDAIGHIERAMRLCPVNPNHYRVMLGRACLLSGDLKRAIDALRAFQEHDPEPGLPALLATALYDDGQREEAKSVLREAIDANSTLTLSGWANRQAFSDPKDLQHIVAVCEELGVPN